MCIRDRGIPAVMLREEKDTFLDDITVEQLGQQLGVKVEVLPTACLLYTSIFIKLRRERFIMKPSL